MNMPGDLSRTRNMLSSIKAQAVSYALMVSFYLLCHYQYVPILYSFTGGIYPISFSYAFNKLLLSDGDLNSKLAQVIVSPSNALFIYPPGIYLITLPLSNVGNVYKFLFLIQLLVPFLIFNLCRNITSATVSTLIALLSIYYCVNPNHFTPDWIIQPVMLLAALILWNTFKESEKEKTLPLILIGFLTGLIMIFKQNIGLFFAVLCLTMIFFDTISYDKKKNKGVFEAALLGVILLGYLAFGLVFIRKVLYFDEIIFYLLPYFFFWGLAIYFVFRNRSIIFNGFSYIKKTLLFTAAFLILPGLIFLWIGGVVGYARYWHSLFGMGFKYLHIWDEGIAGFIKNYVRLREVNSLKGIALNCMQIMNFLLLLLPFCVNCFIVIKLASLIKNKNSEPAEVKKYFLITSMGITGMFMFFPLESMHILLTKLFIFCFVFLYLVRGPSVKSKFCLKYLLIMLLLPVTTFVILKPVKKVETAYGSEEIKKVIGIPMEKTIAEELDKQIAVVKRAIKGERYYVIASGSGLYTLEAFVNNGYEQYYREMRKGIMSQEVVDEIISILNKLPFAVVRRNDYHKYLEKSQDDPLLLQILDFLHKNYEAVDLYEAPENQTPAIYRIESFVVMKNRKV